MTLSEARRLLGVAPDADPAAVARAFRAAARRTHPDLAGGDAAEFRRCAEAYRRLKRAVPAGEPALRPAARRPGEARMRGDDLWVTAHVPPKVLAAGGRIVLETPAGRRVAWVSRGAGEMGLLRLPGQGRPPRGDLFVRLVAREPDESGAKALLRRFAAAWAA